MNDTFMKERPVFPLILSMALPMVISMLVNSLYNIVDSFFVAKISEDAMTALSLVFPVQNFANAIAIGFGIGINTPSMMKMALAAVPASKMGAGSGLFSMFRDLGSPTGSSLSLAVFGASLAYATQDAIMRQTAALGLDTANLEALARATGSRARELPAEVATRLGEAGLSANTVLAEANIAGLNTALTNVGYMLLGLIGLALVLSLRLARTRAAA